MLMLMACISNNGVIYGYFGITRYIYLIGIYYYYYLFIFKELLFNTWIGGVVNRRPDLGSLEKVREWLFDRDN